MTTQQLIIASSVSTLAAGQFCPRPLISHLVAITHYARVNINTHKKKKEKVLWRFSIGYWWVFWNFNIENEFSLNNEADASDHDAHVVSVNDETCTWCNVAWIVSNIVTAGGGRPHCPKTDHVFWCSFFGNTQQPRVPTRATVKSILIGLFEHSKRPAITGPVLSRFGFDGLGGLLVHIIMHIPAFMVSPLIRRFFVIWQLFLKLNLLI